MLATNIVNGTIANVIGICRLYGISEWFIKNIKSHNFEHNFICSRCNTHFDLIRSQIVSLIDWDNRKKEDILSCNEMVIKKLLE
jgi:hypothetical protein